ncbi:PilZ domain-containing protein [Novosphingobium sp. KA1]|uniref:PilZ domain-containing protein n=1 Tax=Novosphingobium sp. (strain KA1) TaxID=164608 RepID=UPI001A8F4CBE|nr:PilZ domain-containing protein [Novosphingobium sp. KA1]QSR15909.1 hypothetical protein CA833_01635 [Novosphingobium sp. KA1]
MDSRAWDRQIVEKQVDCRLGATTGRVFLYNLSVGGGMIDVGSMRMNVGDSIEIGLGGIQRAAGEVVWAHDGCAGVRFATALHEAVVRHLGFNPPTIGFEEQAPRDRFGRILPPINAGERPALY